MKIKEIYIDEHELFLIWKALAERIVDDDEDQRLINALADGIEVMRVGLDTPLEEAAKDSREKTVICLTCY